MPVESVSFDDESDEPPFVFSGNDLLLSHYDQVDLDWEEVAERTELDERRGLVVLQVGVIEDLLDEFIEYLEDPADHAAFVAELETQMIGKRLERFERDLRQTGILDARAQREVDEVICVVRRRNELT